MRSHRPTNLLLLGVNYFVLQISVNFQTAGGNQICLIIESFNLPVKSQMLFLHPAFEYLNAFQNKEPWACIIYRFLFCKLGEFAVK